MQDSPRAVVAVRVLPHLTCVRHRLNNGATTSLPHLKMGVLVMRSGVVGANNARRLYARVSEALASTTTLPLIFVNVAVTNRIAQNYTLAHEFAHLLPASALSGGDRLLGGSGEEAWCNRALHACCLTRLALRWSDNCADYVQSRGALVSAAGRAPQTGTALV